MDWAYKKLEDCGLKICGIEEKKTGKRGFKNPNQPKSGFGVSKFSGFAIITDKEKFVEALQKGIGREKSYGAGLLLFSTLNS